VRERIELQFGNYSAAQKVPMSWFADGVRRAHTELQDATQVSIALQMVLALERVEYHPIENKNTRRTRGSAG
jgi:cell division inhibitor SulA